MVAKIQKLYDLNIEYQDERVVPIKTIYLYPVRGIMGIKVPEVEIGPHGLTKDRTWCIIWKKRMIPYSNHNSHVLCYLRQEYDLNRPNELRICLKDAETCPNVKKREHILHFDKDLSNQEVVICKNNYRGYKEDDEVCQWLSEIFGTEVILIKAE